MTKSMLSAGAGKAEIVMPDSIFPIEKFERVLDPLHVRTLLLVNDITFAFISVEMTSVRPYALDRMRSMAAEFLEVSKEQVWVGVTHTFSAPHTRSEKALSNEGAVVRKKNDVLCEALYQALLSALHAAKESLQEVRLGFGSASCPVNVNRDQELAEGWWLGADRDGFSDSFVRSLCINRTDGSLMAVLFSYDVQSSVLDGAGGMISSDLAGRASSYLEEQGCPVALFLLGAAGDQAPDMGNAGECATETERIAWKETLGRMLGKAVEEAVSHAEEISVLQGIRYGAQSVICPGQIIPPNMRDLKPARFWQYREDGHRKMVFFWMALGELALIAVKPELCSKTAHHIRSASPYSYTMVFTMVNGAEKYMADELSYERNTYEAMNSMYGKGAAELLEEAVLSFLQEHK